MLCEEESPEAGNNRFNSLSPVSYALKKADDENLPWVLLTQGSRIRLYATANEVGVGRRGRTETFIECQSSLLSDEHTPYLWLLYSVDALTRGGSLHQILENSSRFAGDLAERLRERIYDHVIPVLGQGIATERRMDMPTAEDLEHTYEMTLTVLFRLLFIAYAEDRDLLPYRSNDSYRRRSLKKKAQELVEYVEKDAPIADGDTHWQETVLLFRAVADGNPQWGVPAYDGGLFSDDSDISATGASLASLSLSNKTFETALRKLLVIETPDGVQGPVDFRSLGVREFGTIYEGLLESGLALAETDLALDQRGNYKPARNGDDVVVPCGEIYIHNKSGARKASGSYYTKTFAVEHLLDEALEPALNKHFDCLDRMDDTDVADHFFDFRVADIAMGSGHFLIGAIDRIEKRMANWIADHSIPSVRRDIEELRNAAHQQLGSATFEIEDSQLLRRLIARRCIHGVDLNALSVQLARLAIWIHTFIPGLPLSFLDHNLVRGNALVGVGSIEEIRKKFKEASLPLFEVDAEALLGAAKKPLHRLANVKDATLADISMAREAVLEIRTAVAKTECLCDLITAQSISEDPTIKGFTFDQWGRVSDEKKMMDTAKAAKEQLEGLHALHFPITFPEVFLRDRPGFDVILGNPPWQEATVEEHAFWARHFPGLRGLTQKKQEQEKSRLRADRPDLVAIYESELDEMERVRKALVGGSYPGMGTGDPDFYKAFCWRFWRLSAVEGGHVGVVLPRSVLSAKGSTAFRRIIFDQSVSVKATTLINRARWVFDEVASSYTIALVCLVHGEPVERSIHLRGPFSSYEKFKKSIEKCAFKFNREEVFSWGDTASLPLLPKSDSVAVFAQLRKAPRLDLNEGGGGGHGVRVPTGRWMPRFRRISWCSRIPTKMAVEA